MYRELMIGCGSRREKDLRMPTAQEIAYRSKSSSNDWKPGRFGTEFQNLVTLDINGDHAPTLLCDLSHTPFACYPGAGLDDCARVILEGVVLMSRIDSNSFDEIHAYEVLEHIGQQGDYKTFFAQFAELWRIMKPGALLFATCPSWCSPWAWGDPSHTRVITSGTLAFLSQKEYAAQVGKTPMSDFRHIYTADFDVLMTHEDEHTHMFILRAVK